MGVIINNNTLIDDVVNNAPTVEVVEVDKGSVTVNVDKSNVTVSVGESNVIVNTPVKQDMLIAETASIGLPGPPGPAGPAGPPGYGVAVLWDNVENKPTAFTPEPHVHSEYILVEEFTGAMESHIEDVEPHTAYDDMQSLRLIFENRLV